MWKIMCDGCGRMLKDGDTVYPIGIEKVKNGLLSGEGTTIRHLCPACFCVLAAGFSANSSTQEEPEGEEEGEDDLYDITDPDADCYRGVDSDVESGTDGDSDGGDGAGGDTEGEGEGSGIPYQEEITDQEEDPSAEEIPETEGMPEAKTGGQRTDVGKVMALHNAGWDTAKIADEMRTNKKKIYNIIWYQKHKNS